MIEIDESEAKELLPGRVDKIQLWTYRVLCCWFFLLGTADLTILHQDWYVGAVQLVLGAVWIFLVRQVSEMQRSKRRRSQECLRAADQFRQELAALDPTNAKVPLVIEEEP